MGLSRSALMVAAPPLLALGVIAALVNPGLASPAVVDSTVGAPVPEVPTSHGSSAVARPAAGQTVVTTVPAVTFTEVARVHDDRLHVPVALMDPTATGTVSLQGVAGCSAPLTPNAATWLDCPGGSALGHRLVVRLDDGRAFIGPTVGGG